MRRRPAGVATGEALSRRPSVSVETGHADAAGTPRRSAVGAASGAAATPRPTGMPGTPRRTCVVCRAAAAKRELHRIVRGPDGTVAYDPTGKAAGRGAYLCGRPDCLETAVRRRSILRALKVRDAAAAEAAVEALRNRTTNVERVGAAGDRSSDDKEVRSG
jgi:predicted RNA-binding protein YlxR (DUF448 family)